MDLAKLQIAIDSTQAEKANVALDKLVETGAKAEKSTGALSQSLASLDKRLEDIRKVIEVSNQHLNQMAQYSANAQKSSGALGQTVTQTGKAIDATGKATAVLGQTVTQAGKAIDTTGKSTMVLGQNSAVLNKQIEQTRRSMDQLNTTQISTSGIVDKLTGLFITLGIAIGAKEILESADAYNLLQSRLEAITKSTGDYKGVASELLDISVKTGSSLESDVQVFQNLSIGAKDLGKSNKDILNLVKGVEELGVQGGASTTALKYGLLQFGEIASLGVVQMRHFRGLLMDLPLVVEQIAKGMGVTVGQLTAGVAQGKVSAKVFFDSLLKQTGDIDKAFSGLYPSLARALTGFHTEFTAFSAEFLNQLNVIPTLSGGIRAMGEAFAVLKDHVQEATVALTAFAAVLVLINLGNIAALLTTVGEGFFAVAVAAANTEATMAALTVGFGNLVAGASLFGESLLIFLDANPLVGVLAGSIITLAGGVLLLKKHMEDVTHESVSFNQMFRVMGSYIKDAAAMWTLFVDALTSGYSVFGVIRQMFEEQDRAFLIFRAAMPVLIEYVKEFIKDLEKLPIVNANILAMGQAFGLVGDYLKDVQKTWNEFSRDFEERIKKIQFSDDIKQAEALAKAHGQTMKQLLNDYEQLSRKSADGGFKTFMSQKDFQQFSQTAGGGGFSAFLSQYDKFVSDKHADAVANAEELAKIEQKRLKYLQDVADAQQKAAQTEKDYVDQLNRELGNQQNLYSILQTQGISAYEKQLELLKAQSTTLDKHLETTKAIGKVIIENGAKTFISADGKTVTKPEGLGVGQAPAGATGPAANFAYIKSTLDSLGIPINYHGGYNDGGQHMPGSLHPFGRAADIPANTPQEKLNQLAALGFSILRENYTGNGKSGVSSGPHIHISFGGVGGVGAPNLAGVTAGNYDPSGTGIINIRQDLAELTKKGYVGKELQDIQEKRFTGNLYDVITKGNDIKNYNDLTAAVSKGVFQFNAAKKAIESHSDALKQNNMIEDDQVKKMQAVNDALTAAQDNLKGAQYVESTKLSLDNETRLLQARKDGLEVLKTTQRQIQIENQLRSQGLDINAPVFSINGAQAREAQANLQQAYIVQDEELRVEKQKSYDLEISQINNLSQARSQGAEFNTTTMQMEFKAYEEAIRQRERENQVISENLDLLSEDGQKRLEQLKYLDDLKVSLDQLGQKQQQIANFNQQIGQSFSDSFESAILEGKKLSDVIRDLALSLAKLLYEQFVAPKIIGLFSHLLPSGGGATTGASFAPIPNYSSFSLHAKGDAFAGGNIMPFYRGGVVSSPTVFPFAKGTGLMGEAGPEAIMPLRRLSNGDLGVQFQGGSGGGITINNHVNVSVEGGSGSKEQNEDVANKVSKAVVVQLKAMIADEIRISQRPGGQLSKGARI